MLLFILASLALTGCKLLQSVGLLKTSEQVAPPMFTPAGGLYDSAQVVKIADSTSGATIYYTTDGSTPTASSAKYSGPITVLENGTTRTVEAVAMKGGMLASAVAATEFEITAAPQTTAPVFSPGGGSYGTDQVVTISDGSSAATIYYTTDGSTPSVSSAVYSGPISVAGNGAKITIRAMAIAPGEAASPVITTNYQINYAQAAITLHLGGLLPPTGILSVNTNVTLSTTPTGQSIYYTLTPGTSGTTPTTSSTLYTGAIPITGVGQVETIEAIAAGAGLASSPVSTITYKLLANITTVAGNGSSPDAGNGNPATSASLDSPITVALSPSGTFLYIVDTSGEIREVNLAASPPTISTLATVPAADVIAVGPAGNLYVTTYNDNVVSKITPSGVASIVAGNGTISGLSGSYTITAGTTGGTSCTYETPGTTSCYGDGGLATSANLNQPQGIAVDPAGNIFIGDDGHYLIREVNAATGTISTIAGTGTPGYSGHNGAATSAEINSTTAIALGPSGSLYVNDYGNNVVREITNPGASNSIITTVVGNGSAGYSGDGGPATQGSINQPLGIAVDAAGDIYFSSGANNVIRRVNTAGIITTVVGTGTAGFSGDGGEALLAELNAPNGIFLDSSADLFFADQSNQRVREIVVH